MKSDIVRLGSLYLDGQPSDVGATYNCEVLSFGDSAAGKEIQWIKDGSALIASSCVCTNISWKQLNQMGFVFGAPVQIDGSSYLCRCLKVGSNENNPNEWDELLDKYGEDPDFWHWDNAYFWGQETSEYNESAHVVRGYHYARRLDRFSTSSRHAHLGFRPALESLTSKPPEALVGSSIKVFGPHGNSVRGRLVDFDDYDLVLAPENKASFSWVAQRGKQFVVNKSAVIGIAKTQD